jgi:hypothetical protein
VKKCKLKQEQQVTLKAWELLPLQASFLKQKQDQAVLQLKDAKPALERSQAYTVKHANESAVKLSAQL